MAKRPANRRKVMAMCAKCTCNTWVFARLKARSGENDCMGFEMPSLQRVVLCKGIRIVSSPYPN